MGQADLSVGSEQIYTMRELNQDTAQVMRKINESGRPALITRHGRFIAMITPLLGKRVEGAVIASLLRESDVSSDQIEGHAVLEHASPLDDPGPEPERAD